MSSKYGGSTAIDARIDKEIHEKMAAELRGSLGGCGLGPAPRRMEVQGCDLSPAMPRSTISEALAESMDGLLALNARLYTLEDKLTGGIPDCKACEAPSAKPPLRDAVVDLVRQVSDAHVTLSRIFAAL